MFKTCNIMSIIMSNIMSNSQVYELKNISNKILRIDNNIKYLYSQDFWKIDSKD